MRVIAVTGGKGGVGKTTMSINLAIAMAKQGRRVLLFDADLGLANVDVMLDLQIKRNINDYFQGLCQLQDVCVQGPEHITIIPGASGIQQLTELNRNKLVELIKSFSTLTDEYDTLIVDTASGISHHVIDLTQATQNILLVVCNEPSSLVDSYALVKILHQKYKRKNFGVVVNKVADGQEGYDVFSTFQSALSQFVHIGTQYLGYIPRDDFIRIATHERCAVVEKFEQSSAAGAFHMLCHGIEHWCDQSSEAGGIQFFFERTIREPQESEV